MPRNGGFFGRVLEEVEDRFGVSVQPVEHVELMEAEIADGRSARRELDLLAYTALDYAAGRSQDLTPEARRSIAQRSRVVWMRDPMAGANVDLMNDFVFGKGVPRPKAKDPEVQKVIDEFWDDPDNQRILTSHQAQLALGTDLTLQSNLFFLLFDDGKDGKVKISLLEHDSVRNIVKDPDDRFCHLWYVAEIRREEWDFKTHGPIIDRRPRNLMDNVRYFEHWSNYAEKLDQSENASKAGNDSIEPPPTPPDNLIGDGKVFHIAENRTTEMAFGHPRMDRTLRWLSSYNTFMKARVDMMQAAAAFVMKRKVKGTASQLARQASQALSRRSDAAVGYSDGLMGGPAPASIINENDGVTHEAFKIDTGAANAVQDAGQLRSQISAATRWSPAYYGDLSNGNLSQASSLELPILKSVETRQEMFEGLIRWGVDRAIERAVETKKLDEKLTPEEIAAKRVDDGTGGMPASPDVPAEGQTAPATLSLVQAHEDKAIDEESTQRDLGYEFSMPNPLRRALGDIVTAVQTVAQTFDPNNTNVELSRALLLISLEEMEVQDAAELVEKIFPPGYQDPALAAMGAAPMGEFGPANQQQPGQPPPGAVGANGDVHQAGNPYGAPMNARTPEQVATMQQAAWWPRNRDGEPWPVHLVEGVLNNAPEPKPEPQLELVAGTLFETIVEPAVAEALALVENGG